MTRSLLLSPNHTFCIPEYAIEEIKKHNELIASKSGLGKHELKLLFDLLLENVEVIPFEKIRAKYHEAEQVMASIDEKDVPFLALALSIDCDGIWSNDGDFKKQRMVKVWNTPEILKTIC